MLQNAYFLAKIGADTAENEQHFAEILPKIGNLWGRRRTRAQRAAARPFLAARPRRVPASAATPPKLVLFRRTSVDILSLERCKALQIL